jgi:hypothetical protein
MRRQRIDLPIPLFFFVCCFFSFPKLLCLSFEIELIHVYRSYCNSKVRDKPKVVRSLRRCAPLWPIAELKIVLCLTTTIRTMLYHRRIAVIFQLTLLPMRRGSLERFPKGFFFVKSGFVIKVFSMPSSWLLILNARYVHLEVPYFGTEKLNLFFFVFGRGIDFFSIQKYAT